MKRFTIKLMVFLLAGAIINVAVAWGLANASLIDSPEEKISETTSLTIATALAGPGWPHECTEGHVSRGWGVDHTDIGGMVGNSPWILVITRAGLPFRAVSGGFIADPDGMRLRNSHIVNGLELIYMPIFPGFAINTIFYAGLLWMLFAVPGAVRRRVRRNRGQCASCGYSLRENSSEKCPECGAVVLTRSTA